MENVVSGLSDDVENAFATGGKWETVSASANYVAKPWQFVLANPTNAAFGVLLPDPRLCKLARVTVKNDSSSPNVLTMTVQGGLTIDGAASATIGLARQQKEFISDGREWKTSAISSQASTQGSYVVQLGSDANVTANRNVYLRMPATTAARTVSLPASPSDGDFVMVRVANAVAFNITVSGNGHNINDGFYAAASIYVMPNDGQVTGFAYIAADSEWEVF